MSDVFISTVLSTEKSQHFNNFLGEICYYLVDVLSFWSK